MTAGLREYWGLPANNQAGNANGEFGQNFRAGLDGLNQDLQVIAVRGDLAEHQKLDANRQTLIKVYQTTAKLGDAAKNDQVMGAVNKVREQTSIKATALNAGYEEWQKREAAFDAAVVKIGELEDAAHPKAEAYRKLSEGIRFQANSRNYSDAVAALDQLQPKLEKLVGEPLQLAGGTNMAAPGGSGGNQPPFKGAYEVEIVNKTISKKTKYGELKLTATIKAMPTVGGDGSKSPVGSSTTGTSKIKDDKRQGGIKQTFSYQDIKNLKILDSLDISDISIGFETEWSGVEISASAILKGKINTRFFSAPVSTKFILFTAKEDESPKFFGVEVKIAPQQFTVKVAGVETPLFTEYKATFVLDPKAVGKEIVEKLAEKKLKEEAKKQGVKILLRKGGEKVLTRLGPLVTAFGIGWDIGSLLNKYTVADDVARMVIDAMMGDFAEKYQEADTLGKMLLIHRHAPTIIATLVAAGVAGVAAGVGDIVLFKIMHLDMIGPAFNQALTVFQELVKVVPNVGQAMADAIIDNAIKLGIKLNPKYRTIADASVNRIALAVFKVLKPVYKKKGGLNDLISMRLHDADIEPADLHKLAELVVAQKLKFAGLDPSLSAEEVVLQLLDLTVAGFVTFLETHRLISYKITFGDDMSLDSLPEELIAEVFN